MKLAVLNKVCFEIAVASILAGGVLGLVMLRKPDGRETPWRLVATVGIVFLCSLATLSVSRTYAEPPGSARHQSIDDENTKERPAP